LRGTHGKAFRRSYLRGIGYRAHNVTLLKDLIYMFFTLAILRNPRSRHAY
jgi:hypothetical protein